ncbi:MAG TPA: PadR family transcriptional regulator [Candidatus Binatia bacterium]
MFRFVVLGLLQQSGPGHGYALMKRYRDRAGVQISTGNFYRELQRLMSSGFVGFAAREPDADARRAPYEILDQGRDALVQWIGTPVAPAEAGEDPISSRAMFLDCVPHDAALALIDDWKDALETTRAVLQREHDEACRKSAQSEGFTILPQLLARRLAHVTSDLAFLDQVRAVVDEWHQRGASETRDGGTSSDRRDRGAPRQTAARAGGGSSQQR